MNHITEGSDRTTMQKLKLKTGLKGVVEDTGCWREGFSWKPKWRETKSWLDFTKPFTFSITEAIGSIFFSETKERLKILEKSGL